jgi:hypothetical protein
VCFFARQEQVGKKKKGGPNKTKTGEENEESGRTQRGTMDWVSSSLVGALLPPLNPFLSFSSSLPIFSLFFFVPLFFSALALPRHLVLLALALLQQRPSVGLAAFNCSAGSGKI